MVATLGAAAIGALVSSGVDPLVAGLCLPALAVVSGYVPPMAATMLAAILREGLW
jgi:hypothetical protein